MPKPHVVNSTQANQQLKWGIDALAGLLAPTFGPIGGLVVNESSSNRQPELLSDSATIAHRIISLGSPQQDIGAMLIRSLVRQVGEQVGDGGTMTALLARAIYNEGLRLVAAGVNPMALSNGVNEAVSIVLSALQSQVRPVETENELAGLALTLVNKRPLAAVLGEMCYLLGPDAHIIIENHVAPFLQHRYLAGAHYPARIASRHLYTRPEQKRAAVTGTLIALIDDPLTEADQVIPLLEVALQRGQKSLAILSPNISGTALNVLVANKEALQEKLSLVAVNLTLNGSEKQSALTDLELLTGAALLGRNYERAPAHVQPDDLGYARRVEISAGTLQVIPNTQTNPAVQRQIEHLRHRLTTLSPTDDNRLPLIKRLAALSGGVGELKLGATSQQTRKVLRAQTKRALRTLSAAQRGGVVAGGGAALYHCLPALKDIQLNGEAALGVQLVERVLSVPLRQLLTNAHIAETGWIMHQVAQSGPSTTFNVLTGQLVNAYQAGIVDAADVLCAAVRTAASGAMMALTTNTIVYRKNPPESME